jgi:hypothetical protein
LISRIAGDVLTIVLILAAAPSAVVAESLVCHPIRRGESATEVARRITGQGRNTYQAWFQIMNASSRFVPKSQYDRVRAGWRACIIGSAFQRASSTGDPAKSSEIPEALRGPDEPGAEALVAPGALGTGHTLMATGTLVSAGDNPHPAAPGVLRTIGTVDLTIVWLGSAMCLSLVGWRVLDGYLARRSTASVVVKHFATRFVQEFERPLVRYDLAEHAVRSGFRMVRRGRFDILLAPSKGRRYPNLSDHKKNVEYDVARVLRVLTD